ncbi:KLC1 [Branchiostoma lanceolatum]|uniref:KLC1 protein n=1 Tax=Branchiostoma lanceolatum TaxID=7740 RepID=A0A8J9ZNJ3_BRALA|nr:KLC1 [Branchiostoma lanceolatum]
MFSAADEELTHGKYGEAEDSYAKLLRGAVQDKNLPLQAECLQSLGDVYIEKAQDKQFPIRERVIDLTKAAALYNAAMAMVRDTDETSRLQVLIHRTKLVERVSLKCVGSKAPPSSEQLEQNHKLQLRKIRETAFQRLMECERECCSFDEYPMENTEVMADEYRWALNVHHLYHELADNIKGFIRGLVEECIEVMGQPPCEYALIGLGSLAREETTPFSDFEFSILIEEGKDTERVKEYFRNLTNLLHIKVINLGETILPAMSIRSLNDHASGDIARDWYYDSVTPRGFAFDGAMPWASKTPLGRAATNDKPAQELILTPSQMAAIQEEDRAVKEGFHLADVLSKVAHVAGSLGLVEAYQKMVRDTIHSSLYGENLHLSTVEEGASAATSKDAQGEPRRHWKALMSGLNLKTQEGIYLGLLKVGQSYEVKREIYRFPTAIISTLGICCGVFENSSWDIVERLRHNGVITESAAHNLKIAVCIALALRLRRYIASGAQRDAMTVTPSFALRDDIELDTSDVLSTFNLQNTNALSRFYHSALPLQMALSKVPQSRDSSAMKSNLIELMADQSLFDDSNFTRGLIHLRLGQYEEAETALREAVEDDDDIALHSYALSLRYLEKHEEALAVLLDREAPTMESALSRVLLSLTLSHSFLSTGQEKEAQQCLEQHLDDLPESPEYVATLLNTAVLANRRGDYSKAIDYCLQARSTLVALREGPTELSLTVENNLGTSFTNAGKFVEALDCFQKAWALLRRMYGPNVAHPKYLPILENMSSVYTRMGHHPKAVALAEEGLRMSEALYGDDDRHPTVSHWIGVLAFTLWKGEHIKRAAILARKDLEISKAIYGPVPHSRIVQATVVLASSLGELGDTGVSEKLFKEAIEMAEQLKAGSPQLLSDCFFHMGVVCNMKEDGNRAIEYFKKALEIARSNRKDAYDIASILSSLGYTYFLQEEPTTALTYLEEALEVLRDQSPTALIATTIATIGNAFHMLGNLSEAVAHYEKARSLFKTIFGPRPSLDFAELLISLAGTLLKQGNSVDAIHRGAEGIRMMRDIHGEDSRHPNIVLGLYVVATALFNVGMPEEAVKYGEEIKKLSSQQ